jgi:thiamine pyrophosphate-dependent acetolactate synthase large subunit-like protein
MAFPGDSLNGITDAIRTHDSVGWVHMHNEEAAAFAAGAEAHLTGRDSGPRKDEPAGRHSVGPGVTTLS